MNRACEGGTRRFPAGSKILGTIVSDSHVPKIHGYLKFRPLLTIHQKCVYNEFIGGRRMLKEILSPGQLRVLAALATGRDRQQVAEYLNLSIGNINRTLHNVYWKLEFPKHSGSHSTMAVIQYLREYPDTKLWTEGRKRGNPVTPRTRRLGEGIPRKHNRQATT